MGSEKCTTVTILPQIWISFVAMDNKFKNGIPNQKFKFQTLIKILNWKSKFKIVTKNSGFKIGQCQIKITISVILKFYKISEILKLKKIDNFIILNSVIWPNFGNFSILRFL